MAKQEVNFLESSEISLHRTIVNLRTEEVNKKDDQLESKVDISDF